jgi:hypothetical protein
MTPFELHLAAHPRLTEFYTKALNAAAQVRFLCGRPLWHRQGVTRFRLKVFSQLVTLSTQGAAVKRPL